MAKKGILNNIKTRLFIILALVFMLVVSSIGLVACGNATSDDDTAVKDPTYEYVEDNDDDDGDISNSSFKYAMAGQDASSMPVKSVTGWSLSNDLSSKSSSISSGAISVGNDEWETLIDTLYTDSDYVDYINSLNLESLIKAEKGDDYNVTSDDIKAYIKKNFNPGTHSDDVDGYVYMINNFYNQAHTGYGVAQKLTSSSTVTLEKGQYGKISVWVKTQNVANNSKVGANIVLTNKFNGTEQAKYKISYIKAEEWTNYVIYVKAHDTYDCTISVALGLGYGNSNSDNFEYCTEGTVYFDDVTYETLDTIPSDVSVKHMVYGSDDVIEETEGTVFCYDMSQDVYSGMQSLNFASTDNADYYGPTKTQTSGISFPGGNSASATTVDGGVKISLNKSSYTMKIDNEGKNFKIVNSKNDEDEWQKHYTLVTFDLVNNLDEFSVTDVTVDVYDILGSVQKKRAAVATISTVNDDETPITRVSLLFKNNFETADEREFFINLVVGPAEFKSAKYDYEFATGDVLVSNLRVMSGIIPDSESADYDVYSLLTANLNATTALYASYDEDYSSTDESQTFNMLVAPGNVGTIVTEPTNVSGYYGVTADSTFIKADGANSKVNERSGNGNSDGVAGIINTKYLANYSSVNAETLNFKDGDDDIQPIMIYNKTAGHYGFIGNVNSIDADSFASVSAKIRVTGNAAAYVYLVETSGAEKEVMTFEQFTANTDEVTIANSKDTSALSYVIKVTADMMNEDGWVDVNFYIATGATSKSFRVEIWNGGRDGKDESKSEGYVFFNDVITSTSGAFSEPDRWEDTFSVSGNPLYEVGLDAFGEGSKIVAYKLPLTELEQKFNKEYPDSKVEEHSAKIVWAQNDTMIYSILNSIDVTEVDPYDSISDDEDASQGCTAESDPSTFWLSFSSILLAVLLVLAILALLVKRIRIKHKANASDAKSHYKVTSRAKSAKKIEKKKAEKAKDAYEEDVENVLPEEAAESDELVGGDDNEETSEEKVDDTERTIDDDYVYGDVQDFGETEVTLENDENADKEE